MLLVDRDRDPLTVVPDRDQVTYRVDLNLNQIHAVVPLEVVGGVDQNFIYPGRT